MTITIEKIRKQYESGALTRLMAIREVYYATPEKKRSLKMAAAVVDSMRVLSSVESLKRSYAELLEACKFALEHLKPKGDTRKDYSGHLATATLSKAITNAEKVQL